MQMRSCAMGLIVVSLIASASPAWAAGKKKHKKASTDDDTAAAPADTSASSSKDKDTDSLMDDAAKKKSPSASTSPSEAEKPEAETVAEPDAWEKPPAEAERPKFVKVAPVEQPKGDGRNMDIAVNVGYGFETGTFFTADPYQLGFALTGRYELDSHLVLGVGFEYFVGGSSLSTNATGSALGRAQSARANYLMAHAEIGYNIWFSKVILRPSAWVGLAWGIENPPLYSGTSGVELGLLFAPGLTLNYLLGDKGWYIGVDARLSLILAHNGTNGVMFFGQFGKRF
jgi:hypothetical protein